MAKRKKRQRKIWLLLAALAAVLLISTLWTEREAHQRPGYPPQDLGPVLAKATLSEMDYQFLFAQTGLGAAAIDDLRAQAGGIAEILAIQECFFAPVQYRCDWNSPISREESLIDDTGALISGTHLAPLRNGDILITSASHTFGWRNGHAALIVDAASGQTLESVVLGTNSSLQSTRKWLNYPNFMVLRLKDAPPSLPAEAARQAAERLYDIPYRLSVGMLFPKSQADGAIIGTHCAHLVWQAYDFIGVDLDGDGGLIVTPKDIAASPALEVVQIYGIDPLKLAR